MSSPETIQAPVSEVGRVADAAQSTAPGRALDAARRSPASGSAACRVFILPFEPTNPYQSLLAGGLEAAGATVSGSRYTWRLLSRIRERGSEVLHLHWLHRWFLQTSAVKFLARLPFWLAQLMILRLRGVTLVWTAHNVTNHERRKPLLEWLFTFGTVLLVNRIIVHSESAGSRIRRRYLVPARKLAVIPHGNYIGVYGPPVAAAEARKKLGLPADARILLALGAVRAYKRPVELIEAFRAAAPEDAVLVVAGKPNPLDYEDAVRSAADGCPRVVTRLRFIDDAEIPFFMAAADVVVFPYRDIVTSGAALLGMSYGKPCLAPRLPCFEELFERGGGILYESDGPRELEDALKLAFDRWDELDRLGDEALRRAREFDWNGIGAATRRVYEEAARGT